MVSIDKNNIITMTRGDTFSTPLFINSGKALSPIRYTLVEGDEVFLALMEPNQPFEKAILKKRYDYENLNDHGDVVIKIEHNDTRCLLPGKYFYQIKAKIHDETSEDGYRVNTVVNKTIWNILE